jgi:hypothetical protein
MASGSRSFALPGERTQLVAVPSRLVADSRALAESLTDTVSSTA